MSVRVINKDFKYQERQSDHDNYCAGFALAAILSDLNGDGTICKGEEIYRSLQKYPVTGSGVLFSIALQDVLKGWMGS